MVRLETDNCQLLDAPKQRKDETVNAFVMRVCHVVERVSHVVERVSHAVKW
jgi:hypothetical protein